MHEKAKRRLQKIIRVVLMVLLLFVVVSWWRFAILHPTAGHGAFYVHFKEVITWGRVPELQEENR